MTGAPDVEDHTAAYARKGRDNLMGCTQVGRSIAPGDRRRRPIPSHISAPHPPRHDNGEGCAHVLGCEDLRKGFPFRKCWAKI